MYSINDPPIVDFLRKTTRLNEDKLTSNNHIYVKHIEELLNIEYRIACHHARWFISHIAPIRRHPKLNPLLFASFHKNLLFIFSGLELIRKGLHGAANPLARQVFESVVISKYCSICSNFIVLEQWACSRPIFLTNQILNNIIKPDPTPLKEYWGTLCDHTHFSRIAGQITPELDIEFEREAQLWSFKNLYMLLECNYHLLNTIMINDAMEYEAKLYSPSITEQPYDIPQLRTRARHLFKEAKKLLTRKSISVVYTYKRKWMVE